MRSVKLTVVGDVGVGKTSMLLSYTTNAFPSEYIPSVMDTYDANVMVDGQPIQLSLWDTHGSEDYDRLRPLSYPSTQVFLICFAINNRASFDAVSDKWIPEISHHCPGVPYILCGMKHDLRNDLEADTTNFVSQYEGDSLKTEIGASKYIETSGLTQENLKSVFDDAIRLVINDRLVLDIGGNGGGGNRRRRQRRECKCECDWKEVLNQTWQIFAFLVALSVYILIDIWALYIAYSQYNTKDECWTDLDSLWMHPKIWLIVGSLTSIIGVGLGMLFKTLCGIDEESQDWPRLCFLFFFFVWAIIGYVLCGGIYSFDSCHKQSIGKMTIAWSIVKNIEFCCGSLDIVVNMYKFHFMN